MLSETLIAKICDDVGRVYQMSCEQKTEAVINSELFQKVARQIREEIPDINDTAVLSQMLRIYSEIIRQH